MTCPNVGTMFLLMIRRQSDSVLGARPSCVMWAIHSLSSRATVMFVVPISGSASATMALRSLRASVMFLALTFLRL